MGETSEQKWDRISKESPVITAQLAEAGWTRENNPLHTLVETEINPKDYFEDYHWPQVYGRGANRAIEYADEQNDLFRNTAYSDDFALKKHPATGELVPASAVRWNQPGGISLAATPYQTFDPTLESIGNAYNNEYMQLVADFHNSDKPVGIEHLRGVFPPMTYRRGRGEVWSNVELGQAPELYDDLPGAYSGKPEKKSRGFRNPSRNAPVYWFSQDVENERTNPDRTSWDGFYSRPGIPGLIPGPTKSGWQKNPEYSNHPMGPKIAVDYTAGPGFLSYYHSFAKDPADRRPSREKLYEALSNGSYPRDVTYTVDDLPQVAARGLSGTRLPGSVTNTFSTFPERTLNEELQHFMYPLYMEQDIKSGSYTGPDAHLYKYEGERALEIDEPRRGQSIFPGNAEYFRSSPAALAYSYSVMQAAKGMSKSNEKYFLGRWEIPTEADVMISDMIQALATRTVTPEQLKNPDMKRDDPARSSGRGRVHPSLHYSGDFHKKFEALSEDGHQNFDRFGQIIKEHEQKTGRPYKGWNSDMWKRIRDSAKDPQGLYHYIIQRAPMLLGEKKRNLNEAMV